MRQDRSDRGNAPRIDRKSERVGRPAWGYAPARRAARSSGAIRSRAACGASSVHEMPLPRARPGKPARVGHAPQSRASRPRRVDRTPECGSETEARGRDGGSRATRPRPGRAAKVRRRRIDVREQMRTPGTPVPGVGRFGVARDRRDSSRNALAVGIRVLARRRSGVGRQGPGAAHVRRSRTGSEVSAWNTCRLTSSAGARRAVGRPSAGGSSPAERGARRPPELGILSLTWNAG